MSAYITYEIKGETKAGNQVSILVKLSASPPIETALFLLRERYPSVMEGTIAVTLPAAHKYPARKGPVTHRSMESTAIRRTR